MMRKQYLFSLVLAASVLLNVIPVKAQKGTVETLLSNVDIPALTNDPVEVFGELQRSGRDEIFAQGLADITGDQGDTSDALDAQGVYFYERFRAGTQNLFDATVEKGIEINRVAYEKHKGAAALKPRTLPRSTRGKRVYGKSVREFMTQLGAESDLAVSPFDDKLQIIESETETSQTATASDIKVIDMPDATVTNTQGGETKFNYDQAEMTMTASTTFSQKSEAVSKTGTGKVTKAVKMEWSTSLAWCPDSEGIVRGKARARIFNQTTIIKGTQLAASTVDYLAEFLITAYVNDSAEMTHFDMEGVVSEKIIGYDRALKMGVVQPKPGYKDGNAAVIYNFDKNAPPVDDGDIVLNKTKAKITGIETEEQAQRVLKFANWGLQMPLLDLKFQMKTSKSRWSNGHCVDVECKAPKTALKPNEVIDVNTVSISKHDHGKINAKLNAVGTESVTPENQDGAPAVVYTLTAPAKGEAMILVTSTSKRGIGSGMLTFDEVKKPKKPLVKAPPVKEPGCDGGWTGTVKAVKIKTEKKETGQDGRLVRQVDSKNETFDVKVTVLGTRDTSHGILNNFHGNAESGFFKTSYSEANYAPGKMSCDKTIITTPQTRKIEIQEKGEANGKILVAIALNGSLGIISFTAPDVAAERIISRTYESSCQSYNAVNSSTERGTNLIDFSGPWFEFNFQIDPSFKNELKGSKTVQNSDGSETMFTWDLSRCK